jgi:UDP-N-acetylmuramyl pentapeptide phosphotransferase/UDP-N-acetylglucosamine-1-phosphate transferase
MIEFITALMSFLWAFFIALFAIPSIIQVAHKKQLLDVPNARKSHTNNTPRLGGLAIFAGFLSSYLLFGIIYKEIQYLLSGCLLIFFLGLKDDMISVSAFKKIMVQFIAAGIIVFLGDVRIGSLELLGHTLVLDIGLSYMLSIVFILGITNALNLIDGLDGLAAGLTFIGLLILSYAILNTRSVNYYLIGITVALCGALAGFLRYNLWKASIFMGDTGSLLCGYILSFLLIKTIQISSVENRFDVFMSAFMCVMLPSLDMIRVFFIRVFNGRSPLAADRNHLHHRLIDLGLNSIQIVILLGAFTLITSFIGIVLFYFNAIYSILFLTSIILLFFVGIEVLYLKKK